MLNAFCHGSVLMYNTKLLNPVHVSIFYRPTDLIASLTKKEKPPQIEDLCAPSLAKFNSKQKLFLNPVFDQL